MAKLPTDHEWKTGDIITVRAAPPTSGILFHQGIILVENDKVYVVHNTPMQTNKYGGNIVKETLEEFTTGAKREFKKVERSTITKERLYDVIKETKTEDFNYLHFNCEQFVHYTKTGEIKSHQTRRTLVIILMTLIFSGYMSWKNQKE